jgi:hypothetical protein
MNSPGPQSREEVGHSYRLHVGPRKLRDAPPGGPCSYHGSWRGGSGRGARATTHKPSDDHAAHRIERCNCPRIPPSEVCGDTHGQSCRISGLVTHHENGREGRRVEEEARRDFRDNHARGWAHRVPGSEGACAPLGGRPPEHAQDRDVVRREAGPDEGPRRSPGGARRVAGPQTVQGYLSHRTRAASSPSDSRNEAGFANSPTIPSALASLSACMIEGVLSATVAGVARGQGLPICSPSARFARSTAGGITSLILVHTLSVAALS